MPALAAALAVLIGWPAGERRLFRRLATPPGRGTAGEPWPSARPRGRPRAVVGLLGAFAVVVGATVDGRRGAAVAVVAGVAAATAALLRRRDVGRRRARAGAGDVARAAEALAGLLRTGAIPASALSTLATDHAVLAEAAAEQQVGGDVPTALRRSSARPGGEGLVDLAAAWEVASRTGASLEASIDAIAEDLHRRREIDASVRVELAATRSAGRLLAVLPAAGVLLGYGLGGDPLAFLTGDPVGELCLTLAAVLTSVGLVWLDTLADRASR